MQYIYLFVQVTDVSKEEIIEEFKAKLQLLDQSEADTKVKPLEKKNKKMKSFLVMSDMGIILNKKCLAMTDEHFRMFLNVY